MGNLGRRIFSPPSKTPKFKSWDDGQGGFSAKAPRSGRGARENGECFWMKRNAEGSEVAEQDAEADAKRFFHRQAVGDKFSDFKKTKAPVFPCLPWRWKIL